MNKMDLALLTLQLAEEDLFQKFQRSVENVNVIIATYGEDGGPMGDVMVGPAKGTVQFTYVDEGLDFFLKGVVKLYSEQFNIETGKLMKRLWWDQFYHTMKKKWTREKMNDRSIRGFTSYILNPIY